MNRHLLNEKESQVRALAGSPSHFHNYREYLKKLRNSRLNELATRHSKRVQNRLALPEIDRFVLENYWRRCSRLLDVARDRLSSLASYFNRGAL